MKRVLIISPYFPPVNTPDMQRVRTSLPYFKDYGWDAEVVAVDAKYTDVSQDELLAGSIPGDVKIHLVKALKKSWTSKLGVGGISYRSCWFIRRKVNQLLSKQKFDLIYFSTTQFQVCILGAYWKKRFKVPYVIDMQDPWHAEHYRDKLPKYRLASRLNKYLEAKAMKEVGGLISVSKSYIDILKERYSGLANIPSSVITFGAFKPDFEIADRNQSKFKSLLRPGYKNIVYIGRGGMDIYDAIKPVFETLQQCRVNEPEVFEKVKLYFIGTSYAPKGQQRETVSPFAARYGLTDCVTEITGRIGYYHALTTLQQADALFIPGSDDPQYTASKIFPYLLTHKPLLAIFNSQSSAIAILREFGAKQVYSYDASYGIKLKIEDFLKQVVKAGFGEQQYDAAAMEKYSAKMMTQRQCNLFNEVNLISR